MPEKEEPPIRIVLPLKDHKSANVVRRQLADLGQKISADITPAYTSRKIKDEFRVKEDTPTLVNQQYNGFMLCSTARNSTIRLCVIPYEM